MTNRMTQRPRVAPVVLAALLTVGPHLNAMTVRYSPEARTALSAEARSAIEQIATAAEMDARGLLPQLSRDVVLVVEVGRNVPEQTGETGASIAPGTIRWTVNHELPQGVTAIANAHLRPTLFHEFHHLARGWLISGGAPYTSFMDGVVAEGLATAFERDAAHRPAPWGDYPPEVAAWVKELLALPITARYDQWMFQHPDGRRWIGYKAGTYIADQAMKASGKSAAELVTVPTGEVLRLAGF